VIDFMAKVFTCPEHGVVTGSRCVLCDALKYKNNKKKTLLDEATQKKLRKGQGRKKRDPNSLQIAYRAKKIQKEKEKRRHKSFTKGWRRFWKSKPRIVRQYPDDLLGG
jgi:hypothetical protein